MKEYYYYSTEKTIVWKNLFFLKNPFVKKRVRIYPVKTMMNLIPAMVMLGVVTGIVKNMSKSKVRKRRFTKKKFKREDRYD
jgi:hypothetical protein